jgi:hypothetical protein
MRFLKNTVENDKILMGVSSWCFAYRRRAYLLTIRQIVYAFWKKPNYIRKVTEG